MTRTCINCVYVLEWLVCLGNSPSLFSRPRAVSGDHRGNMNMYTALRWSHHNITWIFIYLHADWCSVKICVSEGCWMKIYASFVSKMVLITTPSVNSLDCDDFIIYVAFPQGPLDAPLPNADCRNGDPKCQVGGNRSQIIFDNILVNWCIIGLLHHRRRRSLFTGEVNLAFSRKLLYFSLSIS